MFWSIKNSGEVLNKLKSRGFRATSLSTYDFSTLYTTLPHNLIKEKLINLIEWTFKREGSPYIACNERQAFFTSEDTKRYKLWSCQNVCEALIYLLDNIYIRFGTKLYRQIVGIPMGTNCAPLVADLFLFCYERDFMTSFFDVKQAEIIEAFKSTSRYLDDLLNIDNPYFEGMVNRIYPPELQLNKANTSDTEAPFLDLHLSISNGFVSSIIYDKRDDFDFDIVNFPFLDGDVPVLPLTGFGPELFCLLLGPPGFNCWFSSAPVFQWCCSTPQGSPGVGCNTFLSSPHLCFIIVFICDLFVSRDDPLMS